MAVSNDTAIDNISDDIEEEKYPVENLLKRS